MKLFPPEWLQASIDADGGGGSRQEISSTAKSGFSAWLDRDGVLVYPRPVPRLQAAGLVQAEA